MKINVMKNFWGGVIASAFLLTALVSLLLAATMLVWSPARSTFTTDKPATYVTFNSITNNPAHGDERNFMQIREDYEIGRASCRERV